MSFKSQYASYWKRVLMEALRPVSEDELEAAHSALNSEDKLTKIRALLHIMYRSMSTNTRVEWGIIEKHVHGVLPVAHVRILCHPDIPPDKETTQVGLALILIFVAVAQVQYEVIFNHLKSLEEDKQLMFCKVFEALMGDDQKDERQRLTQEEFFMLLEQVAKNSMSKSYSTGETPCRKTSAVPKTFTFSPGKTEDSGHVAQIVDSPISHIVTRYKHLAESNSKAIQKTRFELDQEQEKSTELMEELQKSKKEIVKLKHQLQFAKEELIITSQDNEISRLKGEVHYLQKELKILKKQDADDQSVIENKEADLHQLKLENQSLKKNLEEKTKQWKELTQCKCELDIEMFNLTTENVNIKEASQDLQKQIVEMKMIIEELKDNKINTSEDLMDFQSTSEVASSILIADVKEAKEKLEKRCENLSQEQRSLEQSCRTKDSHIQRLENQLIKEQEQRCEMEEKHRQEMGHAVHLAVESERKKQDLLEEKLISIEADLHEAQSNSAKLIETKNETEQVLQAKISELEKTELLLKEVKEEMGTLRIVQKNYAALKLRFDHVQDSSAGFKEAKEKLEKQCESLLKEKRSLEQFCKNKDTQLLELENQLMKEQEQRCQMEEQHRQEMGHAVHSAVESEKKKQDLLDEKLISIEADLHEAQSNSAKLIETKNETEQVLQAKISDLEKTELLLKEVKQEMETLRIVQKNYAELKLRFDHEKDNSAGFKEAKEKLAEQHELISQEKRSLEQFCKNKDTQLLEVEKQLIKEQEQRCEMEEKHRQEMGHAVHSAVESEKKKQDILEKKLISIEADLHEAQSNSAKLIETKNETEQVLQAKISELEKTELLLKEVKQEMETLRIVQENYAALKLRYDHDKAKVRDLIMAKEKLEEQNESLSKEKGSLEQSCKNKDTQLLEVENQLTKEQEQRCEMEEKHRQEMGHAVHSAVESEKKKQDLLEEKLISIKADLHEAQSNSAKLIETKNEMEQVLQSKISELEKTGLLLKEVKDEIESLKIVHEKYGQLKRKFDHDKAKVRDLIMAKEKLEEQNESLSKEKGSLEQSCKNKDTQLLEVENQLTKEQEQRCEMEEKHRQEMGHAVHSAVESEKKKQDLLEEKLISIKADLHEAQSNSAKLIETKNEMEQVLQSKMSDLEKTELLLKEAKEEMESLKNFPEKYEQLKIELEEYKTSAKTNLQGNIDELLKKERKVLKETYSLKMKEACQKVSDAYKGKIEECSAHFTHEIEERDKIISALKAEMAQKEAEYSSRLQQLQSKNAAYEEEMKVLETKENEVNMKYQKAKVMLSQEMKKNKPVTVTSDTQLTKLKDAEKSDKQENEFKVPLNTPGRSKPGRTQSERLIPRRPPAGSGSFFHMEDEPGEAFSSSFLTDLKVGNCAVPDGRLSELARRNTLVPAHLQSTYAAETQFYEESFTETDLRKGTIADVTDKASKLALDSPASNTRSRKSYLEKTKSLDANEGIKNVFVRRKRRSTTPAENSYYLASKKSKNEGSNQGGTRYSKPGPPTPCVKAKHGGVAMNESINSSDMDLSHDKTPLLDTTNASANLSSRLLRSKMGGTPQSLKKVLTGAFSLNKKRRYKLKEKVQSDHV